MSTAYCSLCNVILNDNKCPGCGTLYQPEYEIMRHEDDFTSSHEDEMPELGGVSTGAPSLEAADDEQDPSLIQQLNKKDRPNQGYSETWD